MKTSILILSLVLNVNGAWAVDSLGLKQNIYQNWSFTPLMVRKDKESEIKVKQFKRYLWIDKKPIQVAETNFTYLKNPQEKVDLKTLSQTIINSFPPKTLSMRVISNGIALEGHWKKINRFIKMDITKKEDQVIIVTSFARSGLLNSLLPELNELHSLLKTYDEKKIPKTTFLEYLIPEAYAQSFNPLALTSLLTGGNTTTGASSFLTTNSNVNVNGNVTIGTNAGFNQNWSDSNANIKGINGTLQNTNTNLGNLNTTVDTNWNNTNGRIGSATDMMGVLGTAANANWADTNSQIGQQGAVANQNWTKTNEVVNTNWAESNRIAAQMLDQNHMAKVAFYTAAGAALGSITMNLAVEGVSAGISYLYELFTGTKKKQLDWQDFQNAIQSWDDQLNDLVKLEQIVDEFIGAFDFFSDKTMSNDYIKNLNIAMRDMRFDRDMMMEKFKNEELALGCRRIFYNAADELDQKLKEYDKIIQFANKNNISINKNNNYFCQQLKELQRKILGSETQMQDLRLAILKAENQFYDKNKDAKEKREDNIDDINSDVAKTIKRRQEYNLDASKNLKINYERERDEWISACVDAKNPEGEVIKATIDNRFIHFFKARSMCSTSFDSNHSLQAREAQAQEVFEAENNLRKDLKLAANDTVDVKLSEEQMNWLTRIHVDAYCYQFAHAEESKVPVKCKDFPELLYSMNLSKGYEKAKDAYKNRCEDKYLSGIKKLADKKE